jgi:serine/threonine protein kinase HipA of HipAB toxin-antitoxin module
VAPVHDLVSDAHCTIQRLEIEIGDRDIPLLHEQPDLVLQRPAVQVGTSAGGARAKAVIAWNAATNEVRSGQVEAGDGFDYWLLKFDGVKNNKDRELADPEGYGAVEYAYARMAAAAGVQMAECRLLEEGGRRHFMTKRFDRLPGGGKLHMQSLAAVAHYDFCDPNAYAYEQAFLVIRQLGLPMAAIEEQYRRMAFNIIARNQDDHVKNIAFLMDRSGAWSLSPAYDITWSYNPTGLWTARHQASATASPSMTSTPAPAPRRSMRAAPGRSSRRSATRSNGGRSSPTPPASARTGANPSTRH